MGNVTLVQELWSGYGELLRIQLRDGPIESVILKKVVPPRQEHESSSDQRKRHSYLVERHWYQGGARKCDERCRVAACLGVELDGESSYLLLEDLQQSGFHPDRNPSQSRIRSGLRWLADFHVRFLEEIPEGLWEQGSYWHLETRRAEWQRMPPGPLKTYAEQLDTALKLSRFKTLLHGDPKPANFCWDSQDLAAAVDFQYVGAGCGIRDVALFVDRGMGPERCRESEEHWLNFYFQNLQVALEQTGKAHLFESLQADWRPRFCVAWSDYARFYQGWAGRSSLDSYSQELLDRALTFIRAR